MRPSLRLLRIALALTAISTLVLLARPDAARALWYLWGAFGLVAVVDLFSSTPARRLNVTVSAPTTGYSGGRAQLILRMQAVKGALPRAPEARLSLDPMLGTGILPPFVAGGPGLETGLALPLARRGVFDIRAVAIKWGSHFGLFEIIASWPIAQQITVVPDISPMLNGEIRTQMLPLTEGQKDMRLRGEGSEFHQLRDFVAGMDPRVIDWKRSARGRTLVARETRAERNHQIMLCLDTGALMTETIAGLPKLDRAMNAALALAWAGGLGGDQVGLYSFDSQPRLYVPPQSGARAFARLQASCAGIRYADVATNHTLGLSTLHGRLSRRSLVIVFSDFVDSITAELMVENVTMLTRKHLVLYIALRDPALMALAHPMSVSMQAVAQSIAARQVLAERQVVLDRLARIGVLCLDTTPEALTASLISRYIDIKSRELI